jgi:uncharacterized membrane protein
MQWVRLLGLLLLAAGLALIAASVATGQGQVFLLLFIPIYAGTGVLGFLGILVVFLGFFLMTLGSAWRGVPVPVATVPEVAPPAGIDAPAAPPSPPAKYGGVVMLGPIPIVFGSDAKIAKWMMVLGLILAALVVAAFLLLSFSTLARR